MKTPEQALLNTSIHEILTNSDKLIPMKLLVYISGLLMRFTSKGSICFAVIFDGTGFIQLVFLKNRFTIQEWSQIKLLEKNQRIMVEGIIGFTENGRISLFVEKAPREIVIPESILVKMATNNINLVNMQIMLPKVHHTISSELILQGFVEIEPRYILIDLDDIDSEIFKVIIPGHGTPIYLAPSSLEQLQNVAVTLGSKRVFAVSRNFLSEHNNSLDNHENVVVSGKMMNESLNDTVDVILKLFQSASMKGYLSKDIDASGTETWSKNFSIWPTALKPSTILKPSIDITEPFSLLDCKNGDRAVQYFRFCFPRGSDMLPAVFVDGFYEEYDDGFCTSSFSIYVERIIKVNLNLK